MCAEIVVEHKSGSKNLSLVLRHVVEPDGAIP